MKSPLPNKVLKDCIVNSIEKKEFKWDKFFEAWFRKNGTPLFFLFKKNLGVTNLQYVELFQLINSNIKNGPNKLFFYKAEHVRETFSELLESVIQSIQNSDSKELDNFIETYSSVFEHTVSVDLFYNSTSIFLPPGTKINLDKVVFESGYIHSAGTSIYIRNIKKSNKKAFKENLRNEIVKNKESIPFVIYSHEDFSDFDKESSDQIEKGIDQCKIYIDKMNMGTHRLSQIIDEISNESPFQEKLISPKPGNYKEQHKFKSSESIWLISDRGISGGSIKYPGQSRFYICYKQQYKNESHYYFFDENKPAWKSHTTLPHSLTASLINTSRPHDHGVVICDPFGGTATTYLESKRIEKNTKCITSDYSKIINLLLSDNINIFNFDQNKLELIIKEIKSSKEQLEKSSAGNYELFDSSFHNNYTQAKELINELKNRFPSEENEYCFEEEFINKLSNLTIDARIIFYIALRATLRFNNSLKRKAMKFEDGYKKSADKLISEITKLIKLKTEIEENIHHEEDNHIQVKGKYSLKLIPKNLFSTNYFNHSQIQKDVIAGRDARELEKNSIDVIICDPPYGFNTQEEIHELSQLYSEFIEQSLLALKHGGQLIICLPAESYTGKDLPYCTRMDIISRLVLIKAMNNGKKIVKHASSLPLKEFEPPYYWESDKALRRGILHFRVM